MMRLLLDTHVFIWSVMDHPKLTRKARQIILDADNVYISSASIWEASIKASLGKMDVDVNRLIFEIEASGFSELPVRAVHAAMLRNLPDIHRDPFDRMLVAQALSETLCLLTSDECLSGYGDVVMNIGHLSTSARSREVRKHKDG